MEAKMPATTAECDHYFQSMSKGAQSYVMKVGNNDKKSLFLSYLGGLTRGRATQNHAESENNASQEERITRCLYQSRI